LKLAREGYPFAAAGLLFAGVCWVVVRADVGGVAMTVVAWTFTVLALFVLWFFRDPEPTLPTDDALVVAPGEGKVIVVAEVDEPTFIRGRAHKISIFLSVFDVHVQRSPVTGTVALKEYKPGRYAVAWLDKASDDNEQASLGIETPNGRVLVRQIAGLIARRIITDPAEGDAVERGRRFGLIRFGSRVDLFLPSQWEVLCAAGDRVRVGSSIMARRRPVPARPEPEAH
jgi:phosphatidylserine decarboxylase